MENNNKPVIKSEVEASEKKREDKMKFLYKLLLAGIALTAIVGLTTFIIVSLAELTVPTGDDWTQALEDGYQNFLTNNAGASKLDFLNHNKNISVAYMAFTAIVPIILLAFGAMKIRKSNGSMALMFGMSIAVLGFMMKSNSLINSVSSWSLQVILIQTGAFIGDLLVLIPGGMILYDKKKQSLIR